MLTTLSKDKVLSWKHDEAAKDALLEVSYTVRMLKTHNGEVGCSKKETKQAWGNDSVQKRGRQETKAFHDKTGKANAKGDGLVYHTMRSKGDCKIKNPARRWIGQQEGGALQ